MKKRVLSLLLALCMVFGLVPAAAIPVFADTPDHTIVLSGGVVYKDAASVGNELTGTGISGDNTGSAPVYTFDGVNFTTTAETAIEIRDADATIELVGDNTVKAGDNADNSSSGIFASVDSSKLTVTGEGSLLVTGGAVTGRYASSYGIRSNGYITILNGDVTAIGGASAEVSSCGIFSNQDITVSGGEVHATGGASGFSYGINGDHVTISGMADVEAKGGAATNGNSYGVYGYTSITVSNGSVTAIGGTATNGLSYGIYSSDAVVIEGGEVEAKGGAATNGNSYGVYGYASITVSNGSVTAIGGTASSRSYGIATDAPDSVITISGGSVTAFGGTADNVSCGIFSGSAIGISGGSVTATGGAANSSYGINGDGISVTGGSVTASGETAALNKAPTTTGVTVTAGTSADGSDAQRIFDWGGMGEDIVNNFKYMKLVSEKAYPFLVGEQARIDFGKTADFVIDTAPDTAILRIQVNTEILVEGVDYTLVPNTQSLTIRMTESFTAKDHPEYFYLLMVFFADGTAQTTVTFLEPVVPAAPGETVFFYQGSLYKDKIYYLKPVTVPGVTGDPTPVDGVYTYTFDSVNVTFNEDGKFHILDQNAKLVLLGNNTVIKEDSEIDNTVNNVIQAHNLTLTGDALTVAAGSSKTGEAMGIYCAGDLTVEGVTLKVTASAVDRRSYAINCSDAIIKNSNVTLAAGDTDIGSGRSFGMDCQCLTVENSTLSASAGKGYRSAGLDVQDMTATNSTVTATASDASNTSCGMVGSGAVTIINSAMTMTAGAAASVSNGISMFGGVVLQSGSLKATASASASSWGVYSYGDFKVIDGGLELYGESGALDIHPDQSGYVGTLPIVAGNKADGSDFVPVDELQPQSYRYLQTKLPPQQPGVTPIMRLENFATTEGEFLDQAYYAREARAGDIVTLKVSLSELGERYGLDYRKISVIYKVEGAVQPGSSYDYHGHPIYKDGIATDFMLQEGFNSITAKVYYAGVYAGEFAPFYCLVG